MTYTFKLARRLAVLPQLVALAGLFLFSACAGDTTAPDNLTDANWRDRNISAVSVSPTTITLETNQSAKFHGQIHTSLSDTLSNAVVWSATGGTIDSTGAYVAGTAAGTYSVIVSDAAGTQADTAIVRIAATEAHRSAE